MKETKPQTYRISNEVDAELRKLAKAHGGIDKALRVLLDSVGLEKYRSELTLTPRVEEPPPPPIPTPGQVPMSDYSDATWRSNRKPLLKPKDR